MVPATSFETRPPIVPPRAKEGRKNGRKEGIKKERKKGKRREKREDRRQTSLSRDGVQEAPSKTRVYTLPVAVMDGHRDHGH
jgi:hypothetical protein